MGNETTERRRMRLVNLEFQRGFILRFCLLVVLTAIIISEIVYLKSSSSSTAIFRDSRLSIVTTADFILPILLWSSLLSVVVVGIAAVIFTFITSFRIAGPLLRMEKDVAEFASGKLTVSFQVRRQDQFQSLALALNDMAKNISRTMADVKKCSQELSRSQLSDEAREKVNALNKVLDKFDA